MGCHALLQGVFLTQGSNLGFLDCRWIPYHLSHQGNSKEPFKCVSHSVVSNSLCDPTDCGPPESSVHGILQARILEWIAIPFSRGFSQPRDRTRVSGLQADSLPSEPPGILLRLKVVLLPCLKSTGFLTGCRIRFVCLQGSEGECGKHMKAERGLSPAAAQPCPRSNHRSCQDHGVWPQPGPCPSSAHCRPG